MDTTIVTLCFWLAVVATAASALFYIRDFFSTGESDRWDSLAGNLAVAAFGFLAVSLAVKWLYFGVTEFGIQFSTRSVYALCLLGAYVLAEALYSGRMPKIRVAGTLVMPAVLVLLFYAWAGYGIEYTVTPALNSAWVIVHVILALLAYGALTVALIAAVLQIVEENRLKNKKRLDKVFRKFPPLETLESLTYKAVSISFIFLSLVIVTGALRANMLPAWQQWWADPKILSAIVTWAVFGTYIAGRVFFGWRGRRASLIVIAGFVIAIFTYFVNYIFPSIHNYGRGF
ncbi:MAG: cytochrome c biogenesis protein CcsA [Actinomycetota bacterium]